MKKATLLHQQIDLLRSRGMVIDQEAEARQVLLNVGYYRLGFYWYHLERNTHHRRRAHLFKEGVSFAQVVQIATFDQQLRATLSEALHILERSFKTRIIYYVSNHYRDNNVWFVDPFAVGRSFARDMEQYYNDLRRNKVIAHHHALHPNDRFAPAWKTLEFFTFGDLCKLFQQLRDDKLRAQISTDYQVRNPKIFANYIDALRRLRNACAHGHNVYDFNLPTPIRNNGPVRIPHQHCAHIGGIVQVLLYLLQQVAPTQATILQTTLQEALKAPETLRTCLLQYGLAELETI